MAAVLESLLVKMEQYANNLEALVEDRTMDYFLEKKKTEDLLHELLLKSVCSRLVSGQAVIAETFQSATIYFRLAKGNQSTIFYLFSYMQVSQNKQLVNIWIGQPIGWELCTRY